MNETRTATAHRVLVVDDEPAMRRVLEIMLGRMGYATWSAANGKEALDCLQTQGFDLIVSDLRMPELDGIGLLTRLREQGNAVPVIIITAQGSIESAVQSMRLGACDYLQRPFDVDTLSLAIDRVLTHGRLLRSNAFLSEQAAGDPGGLIGDSAAMRRVRAQIAQVATSTATVLITGATGTGKELVARAIHAQSPRHDQLFVPINCAAIPAELMESELFGHEKGAFTGALRERIGKFELADGGTLFLDEITEMPLALQAKLLRVLQESVIERLGSNQIRKLDLRVIAATNRSPLHAVRAQHLREDLYYRLNVFAIDVPPLHARREDIEALLRHFIGRHAGMQAPDYAPDVVARLQGYAWPGNVRELENLVERALVLSGGNRLEAAHFALPGAASADAGVEMECTADSLTRDAPLDLIRALEAVEARYVREALRRCDGSKTRAAALLGMSERTIWNKIRKYRLGE